MSGQTHPFASIPSIPRFPVLRGLFALLAAGAMAAAEPTTVVVKDGPPGAAIPQNALGLSYETSILLPDDEGRRYFRPDNAALLRVFATLGVENLRIGGNSVDDPKIPVPSEADVDSLFEFAKAAGVRVNYSFRLQDGDPEAAARMASHIATEHGGQLECFAIGNEPGYYKDYAVYSKRWTAIRDAVLEAVPDATFCGPDQNPEPELIKRMVEDFGGEGRLVMITQHNYPFGCSYENPGDGMKDVELLRKVDTADARLRMLSPEAYATYSEIHEGMVAAVKGTDIRYRLTETNSLWFSGLEGASDRHASSLWGLDYLHWWVLHGAEGLNFHTGDRTGGSVNLPCRYAAFVSAPGGYEVRPLGYGLKLFDLAGRGRMLPVEVAPDEDLRGYASRDEGQLFVTLIHPRADDGEREVRLELPAPAGEVEVVWLRAEGDDLAATSADMRLNGSTIGPDGRWEGGWKAVEADAVADQAVTLTMPPASAVVVRIGEP